MKKTLRCMILLLCCVMVSCFLPVVSSAASVNGISVSKSELTPDDVFDLIISVPPAANADTAFIRVEFDASAFDAVSWAPNVHNCIYNCGAGFLVLTSANAARDIDLSHGLEISATMHVHRNASSGNYNFRLTEHSLSYVADNGYEYIELWQPAAEYASVNITSSVTPSVGNTVTENTSTQSQNNTSTQSQNNTSTSDLNPADYSSNDDVTTPSITGSGNTTTESTNNSGDHTSVNNQTNVEDEEVEVIENDNDDAPASAASTGTVTTPTAGKTDTATVSMTSSLKSITGTIKISTDPKFFNSDAEIRFTCTPTTESEAKAAINSTGQKFSAYYPFDISIYDASSNGKLVLPTNGYIDFSFPIPSVIKSKNICVFHVNQGVPELLSSTVSSVDGSDTVNFRAKSFSTYIIAELDTGYTEPAAGTLNNNNSTNNTPAVSSGNTVGTPANPRTGVTAAVTVPTLLVGCVVLSRKVFKRKRTKKYVE